MERQYIPPSHWSLEESIKVLRKLNHKPGDWEDWLHDGQWFMKCKWCKRLFILSGSYGANASYLRQYPNESVTTPGTPGVLDLAWFRENMTTYGWMGDQEVWRTMSCEKFRAFL